MEGLLAICDQEGIDVQYGTITRRKSLLGLFWWEPDGGPVIGLDESLLSHPRLERCVLAEEVGHFYFPPVGSLAGMHFSSSLGRLNTPNRSRDESKAVRWAANYLIPTAQLAEAANSGIRSVDELADYFCVTEWMVWRKLAVIRMDMREQQGLRVKTRDLWAPILVDNLWGLSA